jgi:CRP-like cAMP-binding protein
VRLTGSSSSSRLTRHSDGWRAGWSSSPERFGEPCDDGVRISQEELAGWAGASREATTKALHDLREIGLVDTERRRFTVRSVERLKALTG